MDPNDQRMEHGNLQHGSTEQDIRASRRRFVGAVATTIAAAGTAAAAGGAMAQQGSDTGARGQGSGALRNRKYPKPPFKRQQQEWPALAGKMTPRPDHGEDTYRGSGRLAGRKALITGGDSGMGRAAAIAYAREGADVAISYLPFEEPDAQEVKVLIEKAGRKAVLLPGDIRDEAFCKTLVDKAAEQLGGLDILVSNAARQQSIDSILDLTTEQFDWTLKTNLYANFWICKAAVPHMTNGGAIIVTASVQAYDPSPNLLDYAQTKAAQVAFVKSLAKQLAEMNIRVNAVAPGPIWTPLQVCGGQEPDALVNFGGDTPMKRPGQPAELALAYVTLASDDSSYTTGHVYGVAGGSGQP
jgi:NAD(P)-dependent dehydrogenase (short-subunit alcohol dehydrogenase family)